MNQELFRQQAKYATPAVIDALVEQGADVNAQDDEGITVLMVVSKYNTNPDSIFTLVEHGAAAYARDKRGRFVWDYIQDNKALDDSIICDLYDIDELFLDGSFWRTANLALVKRAIERGGNVNASCGGGRVTLIEASAYSNDPEVIKILIKHGADVEVMNPWGQTPLFDASAHNENPEISKILIEHGADVNARDKYGRTTLMVASSFTKNTEVISNLIANGADVNAQDDKGRTPLMGACKDNKNPDVVTTLIDNGADMNARDNEGKTAWDYIQLNESLKGTEPYDKLKDLHDKSNSDYEGTVTSECAETDINNSDVNYSPPHSYTKIPHWYLESAYKLGPNAFTILGVLINETVGSGKDSCLISDSQLAKKTTISPLAISIAIESLEQRGLIAVKLNTNLKTGGNGPNRYTLLYPLVGQKEPTSQPVESSQKSKKINEKTLISKSFWQTATIASLEDCINKGADVNARDKKGRTPVMLASMYVCQIDFIIILGAFGADLHARDNEGKNALMYASMNNNGTEVLGTLLGFEFNKVDVNTQDKKGKTALIFASMYNKNPEVITKLIERGADVNARDKNGRTALMLATYYNDNLSILITLIDCGADVNAFNLNGKMALDYAKYKGDKEKIKVLKSCNKKENDSAVQEITPISSSVHELSTKFLIDKYWETATPESVQKDIDNGADVNVYNDRGYGVLLFASRYANNPNVINTLFINSVSRDIQDRHNTTSLIWASTYNENPEVIATLIANGEDVNAQNINGNTPLMMAIRYNKNPEVTAALLKHGADTDIRNNNNNIALDLASLKSGDEKRELLENHNKKENESFEEGKRLVRIDHLVAVINEILLKGGPNTTGDDVRIQLDKRGIKYNEKTFSRALSDVRKILGYPNDEQLSKDVGDTDISDCDTQADNDVPKESQKTSDTFTANINDISELSDIIYDKDKREEQFDEIKELLELNDRNTARIHALLVDIRKPRFSKELTNAIAEILLKGGLKTTSDEVRIQLDMRGITYNNLTFRSTLYVVRKRLGYPNDHQISKELRDISDCDTSKKKKRCQRKDSGR